MHDAVIVDAVRSPMGRGRESGALASLHPVELLSQIIRGLIERNGLDPVLVDDVIVGCVSQAGEQAGCPGRGAWLAAGFPDTVPAVTIDRRCGSSQQAVHFAAQGIMAGAYDVVVAAGVESMSRVPMGSARQGKDVFGPSVNARYEPGLVSQGVSAELIAAKWKITRADMDTYAERSHWRAASAAALGGFDREIVAVEVPDGAGGMKSVSSDETIRPSTTAEKLATLPTVFRDEAIGTRYPQITWGVTAGNSSQITDGASALLLMSGERAEQLELRPRARFVGFSVVGDDPIMMLSGPIPATAEVLKRAGLEIGDIDHAEVNEAFASVPLAWQSEFGVPDTVLNPRGGAIALGHPLGASGARAMTTMLHGLEDTGGRFGLQAMCEGSGMANATIIERL
jgi:acetyl-CoA acetyltransferase family protein